MVFCIFQTLIRGHLPQAVPSWSHECPLRGGLTGTPFKQSDIFNIELRWLDQNKWCAVCLSKNQITSLFLTWLPWNFVILYAIYRGIILMWICEIMLVSFSWCYFYWTPLFGKIAILTKLSAKISLKLPQSTYNNMTLQVSPKSSEQKPRDNYNLKTTTPNGIRAFDHCRAFHVWLKSMKLQIKQVHCINIAGSKPHLASWNDKKVLAAIRTA